MELKSNKQSLTSLEITSQKYHDIFDYKLTKKEAVRWQYKNQRIKISKAWPTSLVKDKLQREKYSKNKLVIAKKAANLIAKISTVKFVGITGALAMNNAGKDSDIDLMIVTKVNTLWLTRLLVYLLICIFGIQTRKPKQNIEKDKLCLNMWLDENDLVWGKKDRNIYTAHEIAQVVPLVNKDKTYEKFLYLNKWILNYWPNAVSVPYALSYKPYAANTIKLFEKLAFKIQLWYMSNKITREIVTPTRAIFHPNDWGKVVTSKLSVLDR